MGKAGINGKERDLTLGGECTMQCADDILLSCTLETGGAQAQGQETQVDLFALGQFKKDQETQKIYKFPVAEKAAV